MRTERIMWITLSLTLLATLAIMYSKLSSVKHVFLVQPADEAYRAAATKLFVKEEGTTEDMISKSFYVSYLSFSDRSCIRFVPRPRVYGGATTYCFAKGSPERLIGVDHEAE